MRERRERADECEELAPPLLLAVGAVHVDDGKASSPSERRTEARHYDIGIHPVDADSRGHEAVRRVERTCLGGSLDPANARVLGLGHPASLAEHRGGRIDGVDT